jgi:hypothetical protein
MERTNPTIIAQSRYRLEAALASVLYILVIAGSVYALNHGAAGITKIGAAVAPVLPIVAVALATIRWLQATDEYERQTAITGLAIAGGLTSMLAVTYGFLENAGLPRIPAWYLYLAFTTIFGVATPIVRHASR